MRCFLVNGRLLWTLTSSPTSVFLFFRFPALTSAAETFELGNEDVRSGCCDRIREDDRNFGEEPSSTISLSWKGSVARLKSFGKVNLSRDLPSSCAFLMMSIEEKRSLIFIRTGSRDLRPGKFVSVSVRTFSLCSGSLSISHAGNEGIDDRRAGNEDSTVHISLALKA